MIKDLPSHDLESSGFDSANEKLEAKIVKRIDKKIAELYDLIQKHKTFIIPMEVLA